MQSFLDTIASPNDSSYLTFQQGKFQQEHFVCIMSSKSICGGLQTVSQYPAQLLLKFRLRGLL